MSPTSQFASPMVKIHIHVQKRGMTWAGTSGEDRDRAGVGTEVATGPIVIALDRDRGSAMIGSVPVVIVFIGDRVIMTAQ